MQTFYETNAYLMKTLNNIIHNAVNNNNMHNTFNNNNIQNLFYEHMTK